MKVNGFSNNYYRQSTAKSPEFKGVFKITDPRAVIIKNDEGFWGNDLGHLILDGLMKMFSTTKIQTDNVLVFAGTDQSHNIRPRIVLDGIFDYAFLLKLKALNVKNEYFKLHSASYVLTKVNEDLLTSLDNLPKSNINEFMN